MLEVPFLTCTPSCLCVLVQGGACELKGKHDKQDFQLLVQCLETIGLHPDELATVWAMLSSILQLGNICFRSYEVIQPSVDQTNYCQAMSLIEMVIPVCVCF